MKVYWTKQLAYDKKDEVENFCKKYSLISEWKNGHFNIIDLDESDDTEENIQAIFPTEKLKITKRSNDTAAMSSFKNSVYYLIQDGSSLEDIVNSMDDFIHEYEEEWHGSIDYDTALAHVKKEIGKNTDYWSKHIERGKNIFKGEGKVLLVGAYEDIDRRQKRLIEVASFLEGMIDTDCLIYDHKGSFSFCTFNEEETNLVAVVKYLKKPLLQILGELDNDYDEIFSFDKDDFTKTLLLMRHDEGGGFKDLSEDDDIVLEFLKANSLI